MPIKLKSSEKKQKKKRDITLNQCLSYFVNVGAYKGDGIVEITYRRKEKKLCCIMSVSGIDIFNYSENDIYSACDNFAKATTSLRLPHKYVFTDKNPDLTSNQDFLKYKLNKAEGFNKAFLRNQLEMTRFVQENQRDKMTYLLVFADTNEIEKLKNNCKMYINNMSDTSVHLCEKEEIESFLRRYLCCYDKSKSQKSVLPQNFEVKQGYSVIDGRFVTTLIINDYPASIRSLELASIIQRLSNVTVTMDVGTKPRDVVRKELEKSMDELKSRFVFNRSDAENQDTSTEFAKISAIRDNIVNGNEQMMYITLRLIVSDDSLKKLNDHVDAIQKALQDDGISCFVPINQMKDEFINLVKFDNISNNPFPLQDTFKMQYPFFYQQHIDEKALIFGTTGTSGLVALDFYVRNAVRQSFDMLLLGVKGSGKSATLKSIVRDYIAMGNKVMALDVEGEYEDIARVHNGQVIRMNKNSIINVFQLRKTMDKSRENDVSNASNFAAEISRITTFFYQYIPNMTELEAEELKDVIFDTYQEKGITESTDVSLLQPEDFPIFSDVLDTLRKQLYNSDGSTNKNFTPSRIDSLQKLESYIKQLAEGVYRSMFNGYSTVDVSSSNLIIFDVKALSEMDERIYNAQLFNILSLMWSEVCKNVEYNNNIRNPFDRRYVACLIDEAHRFINAKNTQVTEFIEKLCRRTRKYDAGLWLASQALADFNPTNDGAGTDKVRIIFSLIQYKIILKQSTECIADLHKTFSQFTISEIESTVKFAPGEMLLALGAGKHKLHCYRYIDKATLLYCGNSRDKEEIIHKIFSELYHELPKEDYAIQIMQNKDNFHIGFTDEVMEYIKYSKADSEELYKIVFYAVGQLISEMCSLVN